MRSIFILLVVVGVLLAGCFGGPRPQRGGSSKTTLGGGPGVTTSETVAPENPQTSSTTTVRKRVLREYLPLRAENSGVEMVYPGECSHGPGAVSVGLSAHRPAPVLTGPGARIPLRETTEEEAVTSIGAAQKDTSRELGVRLSNMRGVQWMGILLLIGGPVLGYKLGWFTNGLIAGGVGLALIILAQVLPGNEAWLGLIGLLVMPIVAYAYYKARDDAQTPASAATSASTSSTETK